jgi:small-conductance mechanosensitive channel/CRP-like cAMP-binding protein
MFAAILAQINPPAANTPAPLSIWEAFLQVWDYQIFEVDGQPITINKVVLGVLFLGVGIWVSRILSVVIGRRILPQVGVQSASSVAFQRVIFYLMVGICTLIALRVVSVPLTVFTVLGGALAIGLGFGAQNIVNNFISGWILLAERKVAIGDLIEVEGKVGHVLSIGARSTHVRRPDGIEMLIPNSLMLERTVINWTLTDTDIRTTVRIGVQYGSPVDTVIELMKTTVVEHDKVLPKPEPIIVFEEFGDNALIFDVYFWVRTNQEMTLRLVRSDVRQMLDQLFRSAGIVIAYPQRDLHWHAQDPIEVRMLPAETSGLSVQAAPPSSSDLCSLLRDVDLFNSLNREELAELVPHATRRTYLPGESIVRQGEEGSSLFVIDQGLLRVSVEENGRSRKVAQLLPRQFFGEMSLLTGEARSATVSAVTKTIVHEISSEMLAPILASRPEIAKQLSVALARRKAELESQTASLKDATARQRTLAADIRSRISTFFRLTDIN